MIQTNKVLAILSTTFVLSLLALSFISMAPKAHAVSPEELAVLQDQVDLIAAFVDDAQSSHGEVLGVSYTNTRAYTGQKAALTKQIEGFNEKIASFTKLRDAAQAKLDALNQSASSTNSDTVSSSTKAKVTLKSVDTAATLVANKGEFVVEFNVTANDGDVYIPKKAQRDGVSTASGLSLSSNRTPAAGSKTGVDFTIKKASGGSSSDTRGILIAGTAVNTGVTTATLDSAATAEGDYYKVTKGETKKFTLKVVHDPKTSGSYKLELTSVNWNTKAATATKKEKPKPASEFTTDSLTITKSTTTTGSTYSQGSYSSYPTP